MIDLASQGWDLWMSRMWLAIWQGGLLAVAAYLVTRWVPSLSPRTRTVIWWCVSAKLVVTLVATTPIRLGLLPTAEPEIVVPPTGPLLPNVIPTQPGIVSMTPSSQAEFPWAGLVWAAWLVGFLSLAERLVQQHRNVSELIQRSDAITDPRLLEHMNALAAAMGLKQPVSLRSCVDLASPVIAGLQRPVIIFPASALDSLEEDPLNLALAHELAHLKRRDLLWSWVPILANALFWFFPASWLSLREYSQAREEACDAEALRVTRGQPDTYARLLLAFGTCHQPGAPIAACGASPHFHHLKRRLAMLQRFSVDRRDRATFAFAAMGALLLVPIHVVAREARFSQAILVAEMSVPAPPASVPDVPPVSPARAAVPPAPPMPPLPSEPGRERHVGNNQSENLDAYVYVNGDSQTMSASTEDLRRVNSLKSKYDSHFLWFKRGSSEYVITDATTLKTIDALLAPQIALGHQEEELGNRQRAWDRERGEFIRKAVDLSRKQELYREKTLGLGRELAQMPEDDQDPAKAPIAGKGREFVPSAEDVLREEADVGRRIVELARGWRELGEEQLRLGIVEGEIGRQVQETIARTQVPDMVKGALQQQSKVMVKEINLIGAIKVPADFLKGMMFTRVGGTFREEIFQRDLSILRAAYYDRGFVNVKIDEQLVSISADKRSTSISIKIEEGEAYSIGKLDLSGDLLVPKEGLGKLMTSRQGELFNRSKLSRDISAITDVYLDQGYAYANITPLTQLHTEQRLVDLTFDIKMGNQVYVERIDISGDIKTRDKEIRREMQVHEGELFSGTGERRSKERVTALGFFETVEVRHKPGSDASKVVVTVEVKEKATPAANK